MDNLFELIERFWWVVLIPLASFLLSKKGMFTKTGIKKEIKKEEKEIKKEKEEIKNIEKEVEGAKEEVEEQLEESKEVVDKNIKKKEDRDKEAEKFFPGLKK